MNPGTTPKLTKSTNESSWAPKSFEAFKNRAKRPSIPSKKPANNNNEVAIKYSPTIENLTAVRVMQRLDRVTMLGNNRNKGNIPFLELRIL